MNIYTMNMIILPVKAPFYDDFDEIIYSYVSILYGSFI